MFGGIAMKDTRKLRLITPVDGDRLVGVYGSEEKIEAIILDPDTPDNRTYWAGKIGMYIDPDIFNLVRKRRSEGRV